MFARFRKNSVETMRDDLHSTRIVFEADDGVIHLLWANLEINPGKLQFSGFVKSGPKTWPYRYEMIVFRGFLHFYELRNWLNLSRSKAILFRPRDITVRDRNRRRFRLTITPGFPCDFSIHIYESKGLQVQTIKDMLLAAD